MRARLGSEADASVAACARHIVEAFGFYNAEFRVITRRAPVRFATRDWKGSQRDAVERIELYDRYVSQTIAELRLRLGPRALDRALWAEIRDEFARQIEGLPDSEFTKTFFSSFTSYEPVWSHVSIMSSMSLSMVTKSMRSETTRAL